MSQARTRRAVARSLAAMHALALSPGQAVAQPDPAATPYRPARMIVPWSPASWPDTAASVFTDRLARRRGHQIATDNREGAMGAVAGHAFMQARPGEALFFGTGDLMAAAGLTEPATPFADPAGFLPISTVATDFMMVSVPASLPVRSLAEFVDHARARPGALHWHAMPGTALWIAFNAFLLRAGVEASFAPVRGITMAEVAEERIHATLQPLAVTLPFARKGSVRLLATPSRARAATAPGIPTAAEAGFPEFWVEGVLGVFGWRGMPDAAREEFAAEARAVLAEPALAERYAAAGLLARGSTPAAFEVELDRHRARWTALAREFGAKPNAREEVF